MISATPSLRQRKLPAQSAEALLLRADGYRSAQPILLAAMFELLLIKVRFAGREVEVVPAPEITDCPVNV